MNKILKFFGGIILVVCIFFSIFLFMWIKYPKIFMFQPDNAEIVYKCFGFTKKLSVVGGSAQYFCIGIKYNKKCFDIKYGYYNTSLPTLPRPIMEKVEINCK